MPKKKQLGKLLGIHRPVYKTTVEQFDALIGRSFSYPRPADRPLLNTIRVVMSVPTAATQQRTDMCCVLTLVTVCVCSFVERLSSSKSCTTRWPLRRNWRSGAFGCAAHGCRVSPLRHRNTCGWFQDLHCLHDLGRRSLHSEEFIPGAGLEILATSEESTLVHQILALRDIS